MYLGFLILLLSGASNFAQSRNLQTIFFDSNEPDDIITIISPEEKFDTDCDDNLSTIDLSMTGIRTLSPKNLNHPQTKCLDLQGNEISTLSSEIFDSNLAKLKHLNLANNSLNLNIISSVNGHKNLKELVLDGNNGFSNKLFPLVSLPALRALHLRNNHLKGKIDVKKFTSNFPRLTHLYLSDNNIDIDDFFDTFQYKNITHLHLERNNYVLSGNFINYIYFTDKLTHLYLDGNQLPDLDIVGMGSLRCELHVLSLKHCQIKTITINRNPNLKNLTVFDLSYNQLTRFIAPSRLDGFAPNIQNLSLSHNLISRIPFGLESTTLKVLSFSYNQIVNLTSDCFKQCSNLRMLSLRGNKISQIEADTFLSLTNLEILDLADNKLSSLPPLWTKNLNNLRYLNVNFNYFESAEKISVPPDHVLKHLHLKNNTMKSIVLTPLNLPVGLIIHVAPIL